MTDNPAELLRRAADTIREAAKNASPAPWLTAEGKPWLAQRTVFGQSMHWGDHIAQVCSTDYGQNRIRDAEYIALMHPGVGAALAEWLDYAARRHEALVQAAHQVWGDDTAGRDKHIADETDQRALAVARALLGEVSELDLSGYDVRCPACHRLVGQFIKTEAEARRLIAAHECPEAAPLGEVTE